MNQKDFARRLRSNPTDAERKLWRILRLRQLNGVKFRRQQPLGSYIVDFVSFEAKLIVEVDGGQHAEDKKYDLQRTEWLGSEAFRVMRFWNNEVLENLDDVGNVIWNFLKDRPASRPTI